MFIWDFAAGTVLDALLDWVYSQIVGFLGNFFAVMGNMGVELFDLDWVQSIILFFSRLAWALFAVSLVVSAFECGIEYASGRANIQQTALNILKGFFAVSLFSTLPVRLYELSVTLQGTFAAGLTGYGSSIGEVGKQILTELGEAETLGDVMSTTSLGLTVLTSPIMFLFCVILMAYAVIKVFFANLKRGGILLIQIAVGSLYMFSIPRGYAGGALAAAGPGGPDPLCGPRRRTAPYLRIPGDHGALAVGARDAAHYQGVVHDKGWQATDFGAGVSAVWKPALHRLRPQKVLLKTQGNAPGKVLQPPPRMPGRLGKG